MVVGHDRREVCVFGEVKNDEKWNFSHITIINVGHDHREVCVFGEVKNEEKWNFGHISKICKPIRVKFFKAMAIIVILMKS